MATRKSYIDYVGTGSQTLFPIDFPYISKSHVYATVNGTAVTVGFASIGVVQITPAPASGAAIHIYRKTPADQLAVFPAGSLIRGADLTTGLAQAVYIAQEALDSSAETTDAAASAASALASKTAAAASASSAAASAAAAATFNPSNFYTKTQADGRYAPITSLTGYYTKTEGDGRYGLLSGSNNWSGTNSITSNFLYFNSPPGTNRAIIIQSGGIARHSFGVTAHEESGSNAGSNFYFHQYDDDGNALGYSAQINRATRSWNFYQTPTMAVAPAAADSSGRIPTTAWVQTELGGYTPVDAGNGGKGLTLLMNYPTGTAIAAGATVAGSSLRFTNFAAGTFTVSATAASGTWRNVSGVSAAAGGSYSFQRIS